MGTNGYLKNGALVHNIPVEKAITFSQHLRSKQTNIIPSYNIGLQRRIMYTTNLRKVGGSVMLAIPPVIFDLLHLQAGAAVGLAVDHGHLVVEPTPRRRYSLDELLAQCDASAEISEEDRIWLDSKPIGEELL